MTIESRLVPVLQRWVRTRPRTIVVLFLLAGIAAALSATRIPLQRGLEYLLVADDPERLRNQEIKAEFANDEVLFVGLDLGGPLTELHLAELARLSTAIEEVEGVAEVIDLTTVDDVRDADGLIETGPVVERSDLEAAAKPDCCETGLAAAVRDRVDGHPLFAGTLLSEDATALALLVIPELVDGHSSGAVNAQVVEGVSAVVARSPLPAWIGGYPAAEVDSTRIVMRDLGLLTMVALLLVLLLAAVVQRHWFGLLLVVVTVAWAEAAALGWLGAVQGPLTVVTSVLPTILLATASTYALYTFALLRTLGDVADPGVELLSLLARPCLVSAASTSAGFLALSLMPIKTLQQLGIGLALGILACLLASLLLLPALVQLIRPRLPDAGGVHGGRWSTAGVRLARRPAVVLGVATLLTAAAVAGMLRLEVESDPITYWREDSYHRQADGFLHEKFDGSLFVNVVLTTPEPDGALDPRVLRFAQELLAEAERSEIVSQTSSLLDYLQLVDDTLAPEARGVPAAQRAYLESENLAAQYMLLFESSGSPDDHRHYVNFDRSALNLYLRVSSRSSNAILALRDDLYRFADTVLERPEQLEVEVLGTWLLFPKAMDAITRNMIRGLLVALAAILVLMIFSLHSWRLGLVSVVPNVLPVLVCLGVMGWLGVPISFVTSITGCLALGLAVDDTAHVLGHLRRGQALDGVYRRVGPALFQTTFCLGLGFLAIAFSEFAPIAYLGIATALTLGVALVCDIVLLPSLLALLGWPLEAESVP